MYLPDELIATVRTRLDRATKEGSVHALAAELQACAGTAKRAEVRACIASATASKTVTCDHSAAVANTDTLTIAGQALAAKASVANEDQFLIGSTDALYAANVVACINAHSVLSKIVWAAVTTAASGIITIYSKYPGPIGNLVTLAEAGNGFTLGGSVLASGSSDEVDTYQLGYARAGHVAG
jgi:hypothetical protein